MELECKRCRHRWTYRGKKQLTPAYPLYVTCSTGLAPVVVTRSQSAA